MKKLPLMVALSLLPLLMTGCPNSEESTQVIEPAEQAEVPPPQPPTSTPPIPPQVSETTTLIPPTNPNQRRQDIAQGRNNPFAPIPLDLTVNPPETSAVQPSASAPNQPAPASAPATANPPAPGQPQPTEPTSSVVPTNQPPQVFVPPPPPEPSEALAVSVSGVIQFGDKPVAIVKAPGDSGSRQVTPGAILANGQVLVKAIYPNRQEPTVILEQYGQEVAKVVGGDTEDETFTQ